MDGVSFCQAFIKKIRNGKSVFVDCDRPATESPL